MNEQLIDELWQEAVDATWADNSKAAHEKFAELIVKECAKYVDVMWPHQKEFKGTLDVGKGLKAKFGVE
jgi:hypothetical protein